MYFGIDVGNSDVKVVAGPGLKKRFPSYACLAHDMDLEPEDSDDGFKVIVNNQKWFVGSLARQEGGSREYTKDKAGREYLLPLLLAGVASLSNGNMVVPRIGIGLPINDYRKQSGELVKRICGRYEVKIKGHEMLIAIQPENVIPFPEGAFAWDTILEWDGSQSKNAFSVQSIACIDPGWKTVNFSVLKDFKYVDSMSGTLPNLGLSDAYRAFFKRATRDFDLLPNQIEERFPRDGWRERTELAKRIEDNLRMFWPDVRGFDSIILAGGGGEAFRNKESTESVSYFSFPVTFLNEATFANARIFYKVARKKLK